MCMTSLPFFPRYSVILDDSLLQLFAAAVAQALNVRDGPEPLMLVGSMFSLVISYLTI